MDRHWLITWTCYGSWLPGSGRGFVGNVRDDAGGHVSHNLPGTPYDRDVPELEGWTRERLRGEPVVLDCSDAVALVGQYRETAGVRGWRLEAAAVMFNHTHVVVGVPGDPAPHAVRETFKGWATRALKKLRPPPPRGTFWTAKGSVRKLADVPAAVLYVARRQPDPLATYWDDSWQDVLDGHDREHGAPGTRASRRGPSGPG
ncbi:MAG: hypothetical protein U0804_10125 [Gemmataceae bacterium]